MLPAHASSSAPLIETRRPRVPAWPVIALPSLTLGLVTRHAALLEARECRDFSSCMGDATSAFLEVGAVFVVALIGMLLLRFPLRDLLSVPVAMFLTSWWRGALDKSSLLVGEPYRTAAWPALLWVPLMAATLVTAWLLVRRAATHPVLRVLPVALLLVLPVGLRAVAVEVEHDRDTAAVAATTVTPLHPEPGPGYRHTGTFVATNGTVHLIYEYRDADGRLVAYPGVLLVDARGRGTCAALADEILVGLDDNTCTEGPEMITHEGDRSAVAVRHGDTVVVMHQIDEKGGMDTGRILRALRDAPRVSPDVLAVRQPLF